MPKTCSIKDDELLSLEIQKYACIYDKSHSGHKEKDRVQNAWNSIDAALELTEGKAYSCYSFYHFGNLHVVLKTIYVLFFNFIGEAKRRFENLKKRYSKKKKAFKMATRSGAGGREANVAEAEMKNYDFLSWLSPYLRLRDTENNLPHNNVTELTANESYTETNTNDFEDDGDLSDAYEESIKSLKTGNCTASTKRKSSEECSEKDFMEVIRKTLQEPPVVAKSPDADDIFGMMVANEIRGFSERLKRRLKNDINNLIFKYQEQESDSVGIMNTSSNGICQPSVISNASASVSPITWPNFHALNYNMNNMN